MLRSFGITTRGRCWCWIRGTVQGQSTRIFEGGEMLRARKAFAGETSKKTVRRFEFGVEANARLGLRIKASAQHDLLGVGFGSPGVFWSRSFWVLRDFGVRGECHSRRRGLGGSYSCWTSRSSTECGGCVFGVGVSHRIHCLHSRSPRVKSCLSPETNSSKVHVVLKTWSIYLRQWLEVSTYCYCDSVGWLERRNAVVSNTGWP